MRLFNKAETKTSSEAETKTGSEALLKDLRDLFWLSQRFKTVATSRMHEIQQETTDINLQLVDLESNLITAEAMGNEAEKKELQKTENELLTRLSLLRQKQENLRNESRPVVGRKLMAIVPALVDAEKEYNQSRKEIAEQVAAIDIKIQELKKEKAKIGNMRHPFSECRHIAHDLEKAAGLEKGTVNQRIIDLKGPNKVKNPYFN